MKYPEVTSLEPEGSIKLKVHPVMKCKKKCTNFRVHNKDSVCMPHTTNWYRRQSSHPHWINGSHQGPHFVRMASFQVEMVEEVTTRHDRDSPLRGSHPARDGHSPVASRVEICMLLTLPPTDVNVGIFVLYRSSICIISLNRY